MLHVVTKPISGPEGDIPSGLLVDPTGWKNFNVLVGLRYLRPATLSDTDGLEEVVVNDLGLSSINIYTRAQKAAEKMATARKKKSASKKTKH